MSSADRLTMNGSRHVILPMKSSTKGVHQGIAFAHPMQSALATRPAGLGAGPLRGRGSVALSHAARCVPFAMGLAAGTSYRQPMSEVNTDRARPGLIPRALRGKLRL